MSLVIPSCLPPNKSIEHCTGNIHTFIGRAYLFSPLSALNYHSQHSQCNWLRWKNPHKKGTLNATARWKLAIEVQWKLRLRLLLLPSANITNGKSKKQQNCVFFSLLGMGSQFIRSLSLYLSVFCLKLHSERTYRALAVAARKVQRYSAIHASQNSHIRRKCSFSPFRWLRLGPALSLSLVLALPIGRHSSPSSHPKLMRLSGSLFLALPFAESMACACDCDCNDDILQCGQRFWMAWVICNVCMWRG